MDYENFKLKLMELVQAAFHQEVEVSFEKIPKNNGIMMEGMVFTKEGENASPVIYLQEYYEFWKKGITMEQLVEKILWSYGHYGPQIRITRDYFKDYERLKSHIFYKVISYERNREQLKSIPHRRVLDLAMVFYYQIDEEEMPATILIQNSHLKMWKITEEELVENAKRYTCLNLPAEFLTMEQVTGADNEREDEGRERVSMYILTNRQRQLGAGVIFYPGVMEMAEHLLGDHFYILPSSIHECILVPQDGNYNQEELLHMVTEINEEHVDPREVLADQVYYYLKEDRKIHI